MNPALKALVAAAVGGAVPAAIDALQQCGSDWRTLVAHSTAGAIIAVAYLFSDKPKPEPTPEPKDKDDEQPPPGGNG